MWAGFVEPGFLLVLNVKHNPGAEWLHSGL